MLSELLFVLGWVGLASKRSYGFNVMCVWVGLAGWCPFAPSFAKRRIDGRGATKQAAAAISWTKRAVSKPSDHSSTSLAASASSLIVKHKYVYMWWFLHLCFIVVLSSILWLFLMYILYVVYVVISLVLCYVHVHLSFEFLIVTKTT